MKKKVSFFAATVLIVSLAIFCSLYYLRGRSVIPSDVQSKLDFSPFILKDGLAMDKSSVKYDSSQKGLSFIVNGEDFGKLTVSEQATPRQFIEIPDVYTKLVDGLNRYSVFQNHLGTVYLTKPRDQKDGQTAVLNSSGVLVFVRSQRDLKDDQWRKIFDAMTLQKI